jgi:hypothetical protein
LENGPKVVKTSLKKKMQSKLFLFLFIFILIIGCSTEKERFSTFFDPEYKVIDRGMLDVVVVGHACAGKIQDALSAAKLSAKYHLRSAIGNENHKIKYHEVSRYYTEDKICVEMSASPLPP